MADEERDLKNSRNRLGQLDSDSNISKAEGVDAILMSTHIDGYRVGFRRI